MKYTVEPDIQRPLINPLVLDKFVRTIKPPKAIAPSMIELDDIFYKEKMALKQKE